MKTTLQLVVLLLALVSLSVCCALDIYIDQKTGKDNPSCLVGGKGCPCFSLTYVAENLKEHVNITVHVIGDVQVDSLVQFDSIGLLSVIGGLNSQTVSRLLCVPHLYASECNVSNCFASGLWFSRINSLLISGLEIISCGVKRSSNDSSDIVTKTGVAITHSLNVIVQDLVISSSSETSLLFHNTSGNVSLLSLVVKNNVLLSKQVQPGESFARGIQLFINGNTSTKLTMRNCTFQNITTPSNTSLNPSQLHYANNDWLGFGLGGGLSIFFYSKHNYLLVENCTFENNSAPSGAGLYLNFHQNSNNNSVVFANIKFKQCQAKIAGGGVLLATAPNNFVEIRGCSFFENKAEYGAGTHIHSYFNNFSKSDEHIHFCNCSWIGNRARYSPAVDISPARFILLDTGSLPTPEFRDCIYKNNEIIPAQKGNNQLVSSGIFVISRFTVQFAGTLNFESNNSTALLVNSGRVLFESNTDVSFFNNTAFCGGAIAMHGFSSLVANDNSQFNFIGNRATEFGGALYYYTIEEREIFEGRDCFLTYGGNFSHPIDQRNLTFNFNNNTAAITGSAMYASSFHSCFYAFSDHLSKKHKVQEFLNKIGNFSFDGVYNVSDIHSLVLSTTGHDFLKTNLKTNLKTLYVIPGKKFAIPLTLKDDLNQTVSTEFFVSVDGNQVSLNESHYTINKTVTLFGSENQTGKLTVASISPHRRIEHFFDIQLQPCPPGFYSHDGSCSCSSDTKLQALPGISQCNRNFTAYLTNGYWVGYHNSTLYTGPCPFQFCTSTISEKSLPHSSVLLSQFVCEKNRQGTLCGQCKANNSIRFHSKSFQCKEENNCSYGVILFLVTEILPVFILITLIVVFDVSFSSGSKNGFIFFSQSIRILPLNWSGVVKLSEEYHAFQTGYNIFYGVFNFEVSSAEVMPFCLFKGATVMDILVFKYVTAVLAFTLVILVTICMNHCSCCNRLCKAMKRRNVSVLHGLSACLVICYTELVRVSFFILRRAKLIGAGYSLGPAVTFYGGLEYLGQEHLRYAIPAIFILATVVSFPSILLLVYPSGLKILEFCKLSEHRFVIFTLRCTRINKLLPMFDVFQGGFKDNYRSFSGLYFLYRVILLLPYLFYQNIFGYAILLEIFLLLMLYIHCIFQPYKLRKHNVFDSLLFGNLAMINGLSILVQTIQDNQAATLTLYIQLVLIYIPIIAVIGMLLKKMFGYVKRLLKKSSTDTRLDRVDRNNYQFIEDLDDRDRTLN